MQTKTFHADFASVTIIVNGVPIAVHGEVDITVKEPSKKGDTDKLGWERVKEGITQYCSAALIPAVEK